MALCIATLLNQKFLFLRMSFTITVPTSLCFVIDKRGVFQQEYIVLLCPNTPLSSLPVGSNLYKPQCIANSCCSTFSIAPDIMIWSVTGNQLYILLTLDKYTDLGGKQTLSNKLTTLVILNNFIFP